MPWFCVLLPLISGFAVVPSFLTSDVWIPGMPLELTAPFPVNPLFSCAHIWIACEFLILSAIADAHPVSPPFPLCSQTWFPERFSITHNRIPRSSPFSWCSHLDSLWSLHPLPLTFRSHVNRRPHALTARIPVAPATSFLLHLILLVLYMPLPGCPAISSHPFTPESITWSLTWTNHTPF